MKNFKRVLATVTICTILATSFSLLLINANNNEGVTTGEIKIQYDPVPSVG